MRPAERKRGRPCDEESRARKRVDLLTSAAQQFARRGYPGTDMQAIADAAGVAKGTLYLYFTSKEELFLAAVDQGLRDLQAYIDAAIEPIADPLDRIAEAVRAYLRFFKDRPEQVELLIQERAEFRDRKRPTYFEHRDRRRGCGTRCSPTSSTAADSAPSPSRGSMTCSATCSTAPCSPTTSPAGTNRCRSRWTTSSTWPFTGC
ncbi:MAG: TetR/AcrR family transcriptional regulator [Gemmataceae bacterium]